MDDYGKINSSCPFLKMMCEGVNLDRYGKFGCPSCPARVCWEDLPENKNQYETFAAAFNSRRLETNSLYSKLIHIRGG